VKAQRARARANGVTSPVREFKDEGGWGEPASPTSPAPVEDKKELSGDAENEKMDKGKEKEGEPVRKFRGIPENVKLFEVFWEQVVELIKARPDLSIQDVTALLVSLTNLSLSCYPDRLEYVDKVLGFAREKVKEFADSPDLHSQQTTSHLASLLLAPINSYQSVLTLLALPNYVPLLSAQPHATRRMLAHAIVSSVLKNETVVEDPEDVHGILELCQVLIREQPDAAPLPPGTGIRRGAFNGSEREDVAEEQGWIARMVHLFRSESLGTQFEILQTARRHLEAGGDRMRFTLPAVITSAIKLCRRYKNREHLEDDWTSKVEAILKFVRQLTSILATQVEAPTIALRLFLLAAQIADECGFEDLAYDLYVEAFTVYEEGISESRAQLQAITLVIGTLQGARVFCADNYDTLITKAALHGAKLLKKPHQASAVHLASHMWWQEASTSAPEKGESTTPSGPEKPPTLPQTKDGEDGTDPPKAYPHQDSKRVLECLQKSLRIANSATEEIVTVQLYVDTLDQYLFYLDRGAAAVMPKFVNSLVELVTASIDNISTPDIHPAQRAPPGLLEGVQTPEMITRHFRNTLLYIQAKKVAAEGTPGTRWDDVDIVGALLKMGLGAR